MSNQAFAAAGGGTGASPDTPDAQGAAARSDAKASLPAAKTSAPPAPRSNAASRPGQMAVTRVHHWSDRLFSFGTERPRSLRFRSGEFMMIGLPGDPDPASGKSKSILRAYSIASPVWDDELEFYSIAVPDGPLTSRLQHISPGDCVILGNRPVGTLVLDALRPGKRIWFLATGTGIAPFASLLRDPRTYADFDEVYLVHACRDLAELGYGKALANEIRTSPMLAEVLGEDAGARLGYLPTTTRESSRQTGRITDLIKSGQVFTALGCPPLDKRTDRVMVCGNLAFNLDIKAILEDLGMDEGSNARPADYVVEKAFVD